MAHLGSTAWLGHWVFRSEEEEPAWGDMVGTFAGGDVRAVVHRRAVGDAASEVVHAVRSNKENECHGQVKHRAQGTA